ncbi:Glutamate 5-kinase [Asticcacaulis sp. MM231]
MSSDATKTLPDVLVSARRITIKVGSALIVDAASGVADAAWMRGLAEDIAALMGEGKSVLLVSSGAGALGRRYLGLNS